MCWQREAGIYGVKRRMNKKITVIFLILIICINGITGCASSPENAPKESAAMGTDIKIAATSVAICEILSALGYDNVVAVPETSRELPEKYKGLPTIGAPMNPDMELVKSIAPDLVLSPQSLESSLSGQYTSAGINAAFLDLSSVQGMYSAIDSLGVLLDREAEAKALRDSYEKYMADYKSSKPKAEDCLILMCFPDGFHLIATDKSYVGNLVELAGGKNVYSDYVGDENGFVSINPEDMVSKNPSKIFVFAHYNEEKAFEYMKKEFSTDSSWQYYDAVKNNEVYYLPSELFGMSATFSWDKALEYLKPVFYENE